MSMMKNVIETEDLVFIFIGKRGNKAGIEFCRLIIENAREMKKNIPFDFLSRVFFICIDEMVLTEIFEVIEGYIPEENVLFVNNLNTEGDIWSNVEINDELFSKQIFRAIMFHLDQIENPHVVLCYSISSGLTAGIADYLNNNFAIINPHMEISVFCSIFHSDADGPLAVYWTLLGFNTLLSNRIVGTVFLDYSAIGNYVYYIRNETEEEITFEYYDKIVGLMIYSLTVYDRYPYANLIPYVDLIKNLVLFNKIKFIIPYIITPKKKLRDEEQYYGFLEELIRDGNLFSFTPELMQVAIDKKEYGEYGKDFEYDENEINDLPQKTVLANEFISFGEKHNVNYLYMIRNSLPKAIQYLPGGNHFYTYPLGKTYAIILENNTNIRFFLEDLLDKFDRMVRRKSYFHVLDDLNIDSESFNNVIDSAIALIESYQECESILYESIDEEVDELEIDEEQDLSSDLQDEEDYDNIILEDTEKTEENIELVRAESGGSLLSEDSLDLDGFLDPDSILNPDNSLNSNDSLDSNKSMGSKGAFEEVNAIGSEIIKTIEEEDPKRKNLKQKIKFSEVKKESKKEGVLGWIEVQKEKEEIQLKELEKKKDDLIELKSLMEEEEDKKRLEEEKELEKKKKELAELSDLFSQFD